MAKYSPLERQLEVERDIDNKVINRKDPTREFRKLDSADWKETRLISQAPETVIPVPATRPERLIWWMLDRLQVNFQFQYSFPDIVWTEAVENFRPDFVLPDYHIIIEVFGSYWHTLPGQIEKDRLKQAILLADGWKFLIWWDWEIERNVAALLQRDMPEVLGPRAIIGRPAPYPLDMEEQRRAMKASAASRQWRTGVGLIKYRDPWMKRRKQPREFERGFRDFYPRPREFQLNKREFRSQLEIKPGRRYSGRPEWASKEWQAIEQ